MYRFDRKIGVFPWWLLFLVLLFGKASDAQRGGVPTAQELLVDAFAVMNEVQDYQGVLIKRERFGNQVRKEELAFKFARPFKVYVRYIDPNPGREAIFVRGRNRDRMRAHKGSFPDVTASLHPRNRIAMANNHHPITSFGILEMLEVALAGIEKGVRRGDIELEVTDGGTLYGERMWRLAVHAKKGGQWVEVEHGESLWEFAERVGQDPYVIVHHNDTLDSLSNARAGQELFVPHHYAWRGEYFFGRVSKVLREAISWDQNGRLYEAYSFTVLELDPGLTDIDFDPKNPEYGF